LAGLALTGGAIPGAAQAPVAIKASELTGHPFTAGGLTLTITKLDNHVAVARDLRDTGTGFLILEVVNPTERFTTFSPAWLVIVSNDARQTSPGFVRRRNDRVLPTEAHVAPGATIHNQFNLTEQVRLPAKLYYGETLLAEIVEP
jgi:hypothetical protein